MKFVVGDAVLWLYTAGGKPCEPKAAVIVDTKPAKYCYRVKGKDFNCWVQETEVRNA